MALMLGGLNNPHYQTTLRFEEELKQMIRFYVEVQRLEDNLNFQIQHMLKWAFQTRALVCLPPSKLDSNVLRMKPTRAYGNHKIVTLIDDMKKPEQVLAFQKCLKIALGEDEVNRQRWLYQKCLEDKAFCNLLNGRVDLLHV